MNVSAKFYCHLHFSLLPENKNNVMNNGAKVSKLHSRVINFIKFSSQKWRSTYMLHVEDVLVPDSEENQHCEDGAADEGDGLGDDCGHGRHEDVHVVGRGSVGSRQSRQQLVFKLIKMSTKGNCDYQWSEVK